MLDIPAIVNIGSQSKLAYYLIETPEDLAFLFLCRQQPGVQLHSPTSYQRNDSRSGSGRGNKMVGSSSRGRQRSDASHGRRFRPY